MIVNIIHFKFGRFWPILGTLWPHPVEKRGPISVQARQPGPNNWRRRPHGRAANRQAALAYALLHTTDGCTRSKSLFRTSRFTDRPFRPRPLSAL